MSSKMDTTFATSGPHVSHLMRAESPVLSGSTRTLNDFIVLLVDLDDSNMAELSVRFLKEKNIHPSLTQIRMQVF